MVGAGWERMPAPMMGGEDFSYVLQEVPGAVQIHPARGKQPADDLRQVEPLRNARANPVLRFPQQPTTPGQATFDPQRRPRFHPWSRLQGLRDHSGCQVLVSKLWCASM